MMSGMGCYIGNMKSKLYTRSFSEKTLLSLGNSHIQMSGEDEAKAFNTDFVNHFQSKEMLLKWSMSTTDKRLIRWLSYYLRDFGNSNILSLGSGCCVNEYLLKKHNNNFDITASDFSAFFIEKAKHFFPELNVVQFDFCNESINRFQDCNYDAVVFLGSSFVMDDKKFIKVFRDIREILNPKVIIDFQGGCVSYYMIMRYIMGNWLRNMKLINGVRGKFVGYVRTKDHIKRLYKTSGFVCINELKVSSKYVTILR